MTAPASHAEEEAVTYEVTSESVKVLDIEYFDGHERRQLQNVALPWRETVTMASPRSLGMDGADLRADWRSTIAGRVIWLKDNWVTVRIYIGDTLRCQNTLAVGNAACYGSTSFKS
ncbi:MmpS family transport accessory protein [Mycolicibacter kumamotonensis]|uniref:MmpS family transport accessory protein n=1 Tax=Mycolicibacter kumamotonensis TaxID=354243 RepID=UPI001F199BF8|nr:MmpS family transport accessory protein [Mycolicibacter kumamotonensis]